MSSEERNALMEDMKSFNEPMPSIEIFRYDTEEHSFFGVYKKELTPKIVEAAVRGLPFINYPKLHSKVMEEHYFESVATHQPTKFKGDYTLIPRGRVSWNIDKFIVLVSSWAHDIESELSEFVQPEFALPYFEFVYDEHRDLGHGWSGDM